MKIKELQKTVNIAWSPLPQNPIYLVAGTAAQQLDSSGNSSLEIYSTNFSDPSYDLKLKATSPSQFRFQKIIWSPTGFDGAHSNGLIVGGCEGGHVMIYSAAKLLAHEDGLIARQDKHTGPVSGLDVNPFQTNLLASCASESEIFIWDLNNTSTHMNPGSKTQPLEDVQNVAWNRQVQHILASVFSSRCVIWDLRKSEQIIKLSDTQSRVRWHAIQWHPEVATQVWLASEDDQAPVVQLWDLRYATAPAKTMQIHQRGVLGMSWCPRDTDLMVSCGKDNRIYCWNPNSEAAEGEILSEVATTATWYSDVQWCPRNPALIASSSLDGNVSIYSLFGGTQQQMQTSNKIADSFPGMDQFAQAPMPQQSAQTVYHDLKRAPKWIKRPCGVAFGFGGKLVHFNGKSKTVNITQVVTEPELVERASALERSLGDANYVDYCRQLADQMTDQNGRYLWYFIKANFELNPKEEMLNLLGYNKEDVDSKFAKYVKEEEEAAGNDVDQLSNQLSTLTHSDSSEVECDQSTDRSVDISQPVDNNALFDGIAAAQKERDDQQQQKAKSQFKIPTGEHADSLVVEAVLTGNLEAAVELCIESKRMAEALIIASTAGIEFLSKVQNRFLAQQQTELSHVISALVTRDWLDFVNCCTVDSWKEALVAALRHSERKVVDICERLGDRLLQERTAVAECTRNAMLCYVCAGSLDKLVTAWYQLKQQEHQNVNYKLNTAELQELAEVVMLMSKSLEQQGIALELNGRSADFISEYGSLLASQGALTAALAYIFAIGPSEHPVLDELRERIYNTVNNKRSGGIAARLLAQQQQQQQQSPANQYARQAQQPRGSFSLPAPAVAANPLPNQFQTNAWGAQTPLQPAAVAPPTIFNPAAVPTEPLMQPPRPLSTNSSQGGNSTATAGAGNIAGGLHARSKYVLDPSVAPAAPQGYGAPYNPNANVAPAAPMQPQQPMMPSNFNTSPFSGAGASAGVNVMAPQASSLMQPTMPTYSQSGFYGGTSTYMPGVPPIETAPSQSIGAPPLQNIQRNPTPPPGWNDPPALKSTRARTWYNETDEMSAKHAGTRKWQRIINQEDKTHSVEPKSFLSDSFPIVKAKKSDSITAPITHPLFGVDPNQNQNQNQNGYIDPYQQNTGMGGLPPPPPMTGGNMAGQNANMPNYYNPQTASPQLPQNNNPAAGGFPQQLNFQTSAIGSPQTGWNSPVSANVGYTEQPAAVQRQPEPPKEKPPLPEEYIYLQTVLEELKTQCLAAASDPRTKRKFVDVVKRLENLYDCLRDGRLTPATIAALNQIVQYIQVGDYSNALQTQTQIAFGADFSQCAGFMPGLKVLVQSAADLQVFLR